MFDDFLLNVLATLSALPPSPGTDSNEPSVKPSWPWPVPTPAANISQIVLLGVGGDCRSHRLALGPSAPATALAAGGPTNPTVFEVDLPEVLTFRNTIVPSVPWTRAVPADLAIADWPAALVAAGFNPTQPSVWILEGYVYVVEYVCYVVEYVCSRARVYARMLCLSCAVLALHFNGGKMLVVE